MKQYQIFIAAIVCLLAYTHMSAQTSKARKVHLKDGSLIVGHVIEDNDFHVKLVMESGDTLTVGYRNIVSESEMKAARKLKTRVKPEHKYEGYFVTAGYQRFFMEHTPHVASLTLGKRINRNTNVGIDLGYRWHEEFVSLGGFYIEPQYATAAVYGRRYVLESFTPRLFVDGSLGYAIPTNSSNEFGAIYDFDGGILGTLSAGIHLATYSQISFVIKGGVTYNQTSGTITTEGWDTTFRTNYSKDYLIPFVNVGLEF